MPELRRYFVPGGTYFFTLVTCDRALLFGSQDARAALGGVMREVRSAAAFSTVAMVLMPDHLHALWTLPTGDDDYPDRWKAIKAKFTIEWLSAGHGERAVSAGYGRQRRRGVWQPRFIEHTIRDDDDLHAHADYIHYNPVKHGYVRRPIDWPWSSFHRYVASGDYGETWGAEFVPDLRSVNEALLE